jgi:hypothetical protein
MATIPHMALHFLFKAVADVSYRSDEAMGGILNLASEPSDGYVHGSIATIVFVAPDTVEQRLPGEDSAAVTGKEFKELIFFEG